MANKFLFASLALLLIMTACAPANVPAPTASPEEQTASPEIVIVYHRSGGFAGTDDTWTIAADGTVTHEGQSAAKPQQLTSAQMDELTAAIRAANFMSLEDSYVSEYTCCDRYQYEITVTIGSQSKTVQTIDASPTAPAELNQLIDVLNQLVLTPA
jgi:hypothetical protein